MKLTAQDLQIGNLVLTLDSTHKEKVYAQIWAIEEGQTSILVEKDNCNWFVNIEWIEPIPITPEILEKNGFEKIEKKYYRYFLEEKDYYESARVYFDEEPNVEVRVLDGSEFKGRIKYIHELQQAMRLCHIKGKEIEL